MVFYRKYRPQNFQELIGQDHVKKTLLSAFTSGKLGHAYLFCGPRGPGKTSTARILAKIVNCELGDTVLNQDNPSIEKINERLSRPPGIPRNSCAACGSITDGSNLDLIEIDAASNRGIDDIRDLREKIKLAPSSLQKKVYIIDEVHMLTTEAFNALLKTLEEPPSHVLFILATTEVHKLPQTILSRVQRFDFKMATNEEIKLALKNIVEKEKLKISDDILSLVAEVSEGSFRDAVKNLDQVASSGEVSLEEAQSILKANDFLDITGLLERIVNQDSKGALEIVVKINEAGTNIKEFTNAILKTLGQLLLLKNEAAVEFLKPNLGTSKWEILKHLSAKMDSFKLITYTENFHKSLEQLRYTTIPSLPLEVAVVKSAQHLATQSSVIPAKAGIQATVSGSQIKSGMTNSNDEKLTENQTVPSLADLPTSDDIIVITDKWTYILETIRPYNYSLEALLKQAKVVNCDEANVILEVPYSFHQRILEAPKSRTLLESVLADVLGKSVRVTTVLGKRTVKPEELANVEVAQDDEIVRLASEIFNS